MKKLLYILFLLLSVGLQAQKLSDHNRVLTFYNQNVVHHEAGGPTYETEYQALLDVWGTDPHDTIKTDQNALVDSLKTNEYWARMDLLGVFAQNNETNALVDWMHPDSTFTNVSSTAFTAWQGFEGDGSADYINTNRNLSSETSNYVLDDASFGVYCRNDIDEQGAVLGAEDGTNDCYLYPHFSGAAYYKINCNGNESNASTASTGL